VLPQILRGALATLGIISQEPEAAVARAADQTAHLAGAMVVIYCQPLPDAIEGTRLGGASADLTNPVMLRFKGQDASRLDGTEAKCQIALVLLEGGSPRVTCAPLARQERGAFDALRSELGALGARLRTEILYGELMAAERADACSWQVSPGVGMSGRMLMEKPQGLPFDLASVFSGDARDVRLLATSALAESRRKLDHFYVRPVEAICLNLINQEEHPNG
jgi:hypothetical protein